MLGLNMTGSVPITVALEDMQWLRRFAAMLARDVDEAEDLVQETLVAAWASPPRDAGRPARPWLATVLRNRFRMQRRAGARRELREGIGAGVSATTAEPERELERLEVLRVLLAELDHLAPEDQKILVRRFFEGESAAEIATHLRIPAATVRSRIFRSLQRLRGALDRSFGDRRAWSVAVLLPAPPTSAGQSADVSVKGSTMSITVKALLVAAVGALGVAGWLRLPEVPEIAPATKTAPVLGAASVAVTPKAAWEQRRGEIRRMFPAIAMPVQDVDEDREARRREHDDLEVLRRACLDDLGDRKSGAVTLSVTKIGAPDIGTIYDEIVIVETTYEDKAVLECLVQSMYGWVGEAPSEPFEHHQTSTFVLGEPTGELKGQRIFEGIIGAHINEVRWCETRGKPDAEAVNGRVSVSFTIVEDAEGNTKAKTAIVGETDLPRDVVDCIVNASQRWIFPAAMKDRTLEYRYVLPLPGPRPW
jgi:RNA polymerase sigma factor (sigma-70 family)